MAQVTLGKQYTGGGGKGIVIAVGLGLSISLSFWAQKNGFTLGSIGPLAFGLLAVVVGIWLFKLVRGNSGIGTGLWISIIAIFLALHILFQDVVLELQGNRLGNIALAILSILFIVAVIMVIIKIVMLVKQNPPATPPTTTPPTGTP